MNIPDVKNSNSLLCNQSKDFLRFIPSGLSLSSVINVKFSKQVPDKKVLCFMQAYFS